MAMPATQIRRGMVLVFEGDPCRVVEFRHHTPGNLRAMVQAKLRTCAPDRTSNIDSVLLIRLSAPQWRHTSWSSCIRVVTRITS